MADAREQRFIAQTTRRPAGITSGAAQGYGELAEKLAHASRRGFRESNKLIDEDVAAEHARLTADIYNRTNELAAENEDPATFQAAAQGAVEGALSKAHPENRERLSAYASTRVADHYQRLLKVAEAREDERKLADFQEGLAAKVDEAGWTAQQGGDLTQNRADLIDMLDAATGRKDDSGKETADSYLDDTDAVAILQKYDREVARRSWIGQFERADNKEAFLKKFKGSQPAGLDVGSHDALVNRFEADVAHARAEARAAASAARQEVLFQRAIVGEQVKEVVTLLDSDYAIPDEQVNQAAKAAAAHGFTDFEAQVYRAKRENVAIRELAAQPLDEMAAALNQMPQTVDDARFLERAKRLYDTQKSEREKDPLAAAAKVGVIELPPIDAADPSSWAARVEAADRVRSRWGLQTAVSPLTGAEAERFTVALEDADVDQKLGLLTAALEGVGHDRFGAIVGQLDEHNAGPTTVAASLLAEGGTVGAARTARDVLLGPSFEATHRKAVFDTGPVMDRDILAVLGSAYEADPQAGASVMEAAKQHYVTRAAKLGLTEYDPELMQESVREVSGGVVTWNQGNLVAPRGWSEDDVGNWMGALDADALGRAGAAFPEAAGGLARAADLVRDTGRLVTVGPGRYWVEVDSPTLGRAVLADASGAQLVLEAPAEKPRERSLFEAAALAGPPRPIY